MDVLELFAGVGGFRVGLENSNDDFYITRWSNQWEPSKKTQDAFEVYSYHYPDSVNINKSIEDISNEEFSEMRADLIVGGFPCQDYSVARNKKNELGIEGKKGVLFWQIIRATSVIRPRYLVLENVDRLLKAPSKQRGRDFAIMLSSFNNLNYSVEWRVINAAEYGGKQRRRRLFLFIYRNDTAFSLRIDKKKCSSSIDKNCEYIYHDGLFARQFPIKNFPVKNRIENFQLDNDIVSISDNFTNKFWNSGVMKHGFVTTIETEPYGNEFPIPLREVIQAKNEINEKFYIKSEEKLNKFKYLRGSKKIPRVSKEGHQYIFSEGGMSPSDDLNLPARTMLTSEGTVNRSTHLLNIDNEYRLLTPIEAERLQSFEDDWTRFKRLDDDSVVEVPYRMRMFFMGNALVTEIVRRIGDELELIDSEE